MHAQCSRLTLETQDGHSSASQKLGWLLLSTLAVSLRILLCSSVHLEQGWKVCTTCQRALLVLAALDPRHGEHKGGCSSKSLREGGLLAAGGVVEIAALQSPCHNQACPCFVQAAETLAKGCCCLLFQSFCCCVRLG